ncbi:MAG: magnesium transporter [Candidatus Omnitrophica bacterium]|nr:magnesium transporter [Candidatus Omnitrophota bacterium]
MPVLESYKINPKIKGPRAFGPSEFILFLPEIKEFLENKDFTSLKDLLKNIHSIDIAEGWERLQAQEKIVIFKLLTTHKAIEVFEDLRFTEQSFLLNNLDNTELVPILNEMASDERADLFKELPRKVMKKLFSVMKDEEVEDVRQLLSFDEKTAGSLMTTDFLSIKKDLSARQAILWLQETYKSKSSYHFYHLYVLDEQRRLIGLVDLDALITAPPDILVKDIMFSPQTIKIRADMPEEEVAQKFSRYDLLDAPVVDGQDKFLGVITIDDVVDLIQEENTRQIYEIGKMQPAGGQEIRYATATVGEIIKRRAGWLILLLILHVFSGWILKNFEYALSTVVALVFFIPMILDTGGNAGAQTSITIIRSLATGDANFKNIWRIARLEITSSLIMSFIVGIVAFLRAYWLETEVLLSLVVGITMMSVVLVAILTGLTLPFISKRLGLDPAALAGPITTTVVDVVGLIVYFKIAQLFLQALR